MKAVKKIMAGTLVGALSIGMLGVVPVSAEISIDATKQIKGMSTSGETYVSYDYIKDKKDTPTLNAKAKWDVYEKESVADLSSLKTTKKQYVTVDDGTKKTTYIFAENKDKYSGKCDGTKITFKKGKTEMKDDEVFKDSTIAFQYRTEAGNWADYKPGASGEGGFSLAPYAQQGATLYFRPKSTGAVAKNSQVTIQGAASNDEYYDVPATYLCGKEFKVKIPKKSNGPAINVDFKTNKVKEVKNGQMRAAQGDANITSATWAPATEYDLDSTRKGVFEAKTVKSGKPESKVSIYKWDAVATPEVKVTSTFAPNTTLAPDMLVTKVDSEAKTKSITLKNTSETKTYLVYAGTTEKKGDAVIATIKPGKEVKITDKKAAAGTVLWIAYAGDKATSTLGSATVKSGIVYFPTPSPTAAAGS